MRIAILAGDLRRIAVDGICTSTNPHLALMIGTGGAIRDEGGWAIQQACDRLIEDERTRSGKRYFPVGSAHLTTAGDLPFKGVIHCVASDAFHETSPELIASCVREALRIADHERWSTVAMPLFGTGHAAFPVNEASAASAEALLTSVVHFVRQVVVVVRSLEHAAAVKAALAKVIGAAPLGHEGR